MVRIQQNKSNTKEKKKLIWMFKYVCLKQMWRLQEDTNI